MNTKLIQKALFIKLIVTSISLIFLMASVARAAEKEDFHRFWPDNLFAVEIIDNDFIVMAGYSGTVLRSDNAGDNWQAIYIGKNELIRRLSFVDKKVGWAVGHRGSIFKTTDGALTWSIQHQVPGVYLRDIDFFDDKNGWAVGHDANIWHTNDGGEHWKQQTLNGFTGRDIPRLHGVVAKSRTTALLVGEFGVVAHTEDSGEHWAVTPVTNSITYLSIASNEEKTYLVGLEGTIVELTIATDLQRQVIDDRVTKTAAKKEKRARAKAKRRKREYVPPPVIDIYRANIEYALNPISSGTKEHLFDIAVSKTGSAIVVGRSTVSKIEQGLVTNLSAAENFPLNFIWLGGVSLSASGEFWSPGIRGLMVKGSLDDMTYSQGDHLAMSTNIKLTSSRWDKK